MKALSLLQPGTWEIIDVDEPHEPGPGEALVCVHRVGICGTDASGYLGKMPFFSYPRIPGHELGVEVDHRADNRGENASNRNEWVFDTELGEQSKCVKSQQGSIRVRCHLEERVDDALVVDQLEDQDHNHQGYRHSYVDFLTDFSLVIFMHLLPLCA